MNIPSARKQGDEHGNDLIYKSWSQCPRRGLDYWVGTRMEGLEAHAGAREY